MTLIQIISDHWEAIATTGTGAILFNAVVDAMPTKDEVLAVSSIKDFVALVYDFFYKSTHNFASFRSGQPIPTQPSPTAPQSQK